MSEPTVKPIDIGELRIARSSKLYAGLMLVEHEKPKSRRGLVGKRFGRFTVVDDSGFDKHRHTLCYCLCSCGKLKTVSATKLTRGETVSCGCYGREVRAKQVAAYNALRRKDPSLSYGFKDLTGKRFGRLVAVRFTKSKHRGSVWVCLCDCGRQSKVQSRSLIHGATKSCGCYRRERARDVSQLRWAMEGKRAWGGRWLVAP